ncbi:MAG TPA: hypothetical protein VLT17_05460 [Gemmatimonadales bacterium]|nr:hypothetical protein [Gemmatimonadales bacterium]
MPEAPANGGYMVAAYVIAAVIYVIYSLSLWTRARRALNDTEKGGA